MTPEPIVSLDRDHTNPDRDPHWTRDNQLRGQHALTERVPARYRHATATEPAIVAWIRELVALAATARPAAPAIASGPSLLVVGSTGTGKTHQAYGALAALLSSGVTCRWAFTTAADLYAHLRPRTGTDAEDDFRRYASAPLLVIDDLGAAKTTEWTEEINYRLINHRYERALPTLVTSNVPPRDLGDALGERVASRLTEMTRRVVLKGDDRRRTAPSLAPHPQSELREQAAPRRPVADPDHVRRAITALAYRLGWPAHDQPPHPALRVDCPRCHARAGRCCTRQITRGHRQGEQVPLAQPHPSRIELADGHARPEAHR